MASLALVAAGSLSLGPMLVAAQTAEDPSNVVLVFDVSNSILLSEDGTNIEFAAALNDIADRVEASATELAVGNAEISFVVFGRAAIIYPPGCDRLALNQNPAAIAQLASCLREVADEYEAGSDAPIRDRINTQNTDHVAALREAADLLPSQTTRSAVIFFTDGAHDPPGTDRDDENVVAAVTPAFEGQSPLAILPVGLGAGAGAFESELRAIYDAFLRNMQPCEGRTSFSWPEVVFPSGDEAGVAVANALQEVTCSFIFAPPPTPTPVPTPTPPPPDGPASVQLLSGNESITVQWLPPATGVELVTDYLVRCTPEPGGDPVESAEGVSTEFQTVVEGLEPGVSYRCEVAAVSRNGTSAYTVSAEAVVALGIPPAPGQPRVEPLDSAARVSVDPVAGGAPAEGYVVECTGAAGVPATGTNSTPSVVVTGLTNGDTVTCIVYAENRIGRSPASVASAAFTPCGGLDCTPLLKFGLIGGGALAALLLAAYVARQYRRRNRVWVTAQVDGGENRPLGWGPDLAIRLDRDDAGWFATIRPGGSSIRVRYQGRGRFLVKSSTTTRDVHQGDPAPVRDEDGNMHQLILRNYRQRPRERATAPPPVDSKPATELAGRLEGKEDEPPPTTGGLVG